MILEPALERQAILMTPRGRRELATVYERWSHQLKVSAAVMLNGGRVILESRLEVLAFQLSPAERTSLSSLYARWARQLRVSATVIEARNAQLWAPRPKPRLGWLPLRKRLWN